jgi:hypothetical protein
VHPNPHGSESTQACRHEAGSSALSG